MTQIDLGSGDVFSLTLPSTLPVTIPVGGTATFDVTLSGTDAGTFTDDVTITSSDPVTGSYTFALTGEVVATPLVLTPTPLAFGAVDVGQRPLETLTVDNTAGGVDVDVLDVRVTGPEAAFFTVFAPFTTVAAGTSEDVSVRFRAVAAGDPKTATLEVETATQGTLTASVTGTARPVPIATALPDGGTELAVPSTTSAAAFGRAVTGTDDLTGDGTPDLLVGAGGLDIADRLQNRAYLVDGAAGAIVLDLFTPQTAEDFGGFGAAVAVVGDLNANGTPDLAVGAPGESADLEGDFSRDGRVYVFDGATGEQLRLVTSPNPQTDGFFGAQLAVVPDLTGDGAPELLVGATDGLNRAVEGEQRAYLLDLTNGNVVFTLAPPADAGARNFFGAALAVADVAGDATDDLLVAAPGASVTGLTFTGQVYVFDGADGTLARTLPDATAASGGTNFGRSLAVMGGPTGDPTGDGVPDLLVGARSVPGAPGTAVLFDGASGARVYEVASPAAPTGTFAGALAALPDLTGDGVPDFAAAAPNEGDGTTADGRVYVFDGAAGTLLRTLTPPGAAPDTRFGRGLGRSADLTGDGLGDLLVARDGPVSVLPVAVPVLAAAPNPLAFGTVTEGTGATLALTLTNTGTGDLGDLTATLTGDAPGDFAVAALPESLPAGASATVDVTFAPAGEGPRTATLALDSDDLAAPVEVALDGTGEAAALSPLAAAPAPAAFGTIRVGEPTLLDLTLTNPNDDPVDVTGAAITGSAAFDGQNLAALTPGAPLTVAGGGTATLVLGFFPDAATTEPLTGTLTLTTTAGPLDVALTGEALPALAPAPIDAGLVDLAATPDDISIAFQLDILAPVDTTGRVVAATVDATPATSAFSLDDAQFPTAASGTPPATVGFAPTAPDDLTTFTATVSADLQLDGFTATFPRRFAFTIQVGAAPQLTAEAATDVGTDAATLRGLVNPGGLPTDVTFELAAGTDATAFGDGSVFLTASESPVDGTADAPVTASATGLAPATTYVYRLAGTNAVATEGVQSSGLASFTTTALPFELTATTPARSAVDVPRTPAITLTFNRAVDTESVTDAAVRVAGSQTGRASGTLAATGADVTFTPDAAFLPGETVTVTATTALAAAADGTPLAAAETFRFALAAADAPVAVADDGPFFATPAAPLADGFAPGPAVTADFDADGDLDVAVADTDAGAVYWYAGNGDGTYGARQIVVATGLDAPAALAAADADGDGRPDLFVADRADAGRVAFYRNPLGDTPNPTDWTTGDELLAALRPSSVTPADLDGDGLLDLVVTLAAAPAGAPDLVWFPATAPTTWGTPQPIATDLDSAVDADVGDFNADGALDVVVADEGDGTLGAVVAYENQGQGAGWTFIPVDPTQPRPTSVAVAEIDNDGAVDFAATLGNGVAWYRNETPAGAATSFSPALFLDGSTSNVPNARDLVIGDLVGDGGGFDIAVVGGDGTTDGAVYVFPWNGLDGDFTFAPRVLPRPASNPRTVALGDVDGDEVLDLLVPFADAGEVRGYLNTAPPALAAAPTSLAFGDVDLADGPVVQTVTVSNPGASPLRVTTLTSPGGAFSIGDDLAVGDTLAAGASVDLTVTFAPTTPGVQTGTLTVEATDLGPQTTALAATVDVSGTGIAQQPPTLATNAGLTLDEGATAPITTANSPPPTPDTDAAGLAFTLTAVPASGTLTLADTEGDVTLAAGDAFTQADLDAGALSYTHDGSETTADAFSFS